MIILLNNSVDYLSHGYLETEHLQDLKQNQAKPKKKPNKKFKMADIFKLIKHS